MSDCLMRLKESCLGPVVTPISHTFCHPASLQDAVRYSVEVNLQLLVFTSLLETLLRNQKRA